MPLEKDTAQYLVEKVGKPFIHTMEDDGRQFSDKVMHPILEAQAPTINVTSLKALVEYLKENVDEIESTVMVHVVSPTRVELKSPEFGSHRQRDLYMTADCSEVLPDLILGRYLDQESFLIMLKASFTPAGAREEIINIASAVAAKAELELKDDGVSQDVNIKKGVNRLQNIQVPSPIKLYPYRTFVEVDQPESEMIFRISQDPGFMLKEADGGAWRNKAIKKVQDWLEFELSKAKVEFAKVIA